MSLYYQLFIDNTIYCEHFLEFLLQYYIVPKICIQELLQIP